jgi:hypothetical protein
MTGHKIIGHPDEFQPLLEKEVFFEALDKHTPE